MCPYGIRSKSPGVSFRSRWRGPIFSRLPSRFRPSRGTSLPTGPRSENHPRTESQVPGSESRDRYPEPVCVKGLRGEMKGTRALGDGSSAGSCLSDLVSSEESEACGRV